MSTADDQPGYAEALRELEDILGQLEGEDIDVDVLSTKVERAAELIRLCRGRIRSAELKVEEVVADLDQITDEPDDA